MIIQKTPPYNPNFGITARPTMKRFYANNCYIEKDVAQIKDKTIVITRNYLFGKLASKLYYVKDSAGKWIKSKLKYVEDGKKKVLRSENKCLNG